MSGQDTSRQNPILATDPGDQQRFDQRRITVLRSQIDAVDDTIIRLIVERTEMSSRISAMRSANGKHRRGSWRRI